MNKDSVKASLSRRLQLNQDSKVLIVGLGETGFSVAKFLQTLDIQFAVVDSRDKPPLNDALLENYPNTPVFTGGFDQAAFAVATHLVVSPGVSLQEKSILKAVSAGLKLVSDIDLFACATAKPIVAITGSNGKSTVTTMLGAMGNEDNVTTAIGGNLGVPALNLLDPSVEMYVIELSSFQLERTNVLNAKAATVLNVSADHMDRYEDLAAYAREKQKVFNGDGVMVLNADDESVSRMSEIGRQTLTFSVQKTTGFHLQKSKGEVWLMNASKALIPQSQLPLEGLHNAANALAALALGTAVGLSNEAMCKALKEFKGLEHRMQKIAEISGVTWVNDSKATNIGACIAALLGYQNKVVLIAGGDAKGASMVELAPVIKEKAKCVVLMGKDAKQIEDAINGSVPLYSATTMKEAVKIAANQATSGDSVLLSPACASLDQYKNYQERGEKFIHAVMELAA